MREQPVSATPHDRRPVQHYATCTGAPTINIASIGLATCLMFWQHLFTPRSAAPGIMIRQPERVYKHVERCMQCSHIAIVFVLSFYTISLISYIARYPFFCITESALHFILWQTCSMEHHLGFSARCNCL